MAIDRINFLSDPSSDFRNMYHSNISNDFILRSPGGIFSSVHIVPEKVVNCSVTQEGIRYYKIQWQETWLPEHTLLQYQNHQSLIEAYWLHESEKVATDQTNNVFTVLPDISKTKSPTKYRKIAPQSAVISIPSTEVSASLFSQVTDSAPPIIQQIVNDGTLSNEQAGDSVESHSDVVQITTNDDMSESTEATNSILSQNILENSVLKAQLNAILEETTSNLHSNPNVDEGDITIEVTLAPSQQAESKVNALSQFSTLAATRKQKHVIQMDNFELVNIENFDVTEEVLKEAAIDTLNSFKRKRVRFPHGTSKLPQTCFFCLRTISNRKKLREHQFSTHFKNVGEFICHICAQRFVFKRQLKEHLITHTDIRQFSCKICGLTCKRRSHLHKHMDTHNKERNYRCDVCHENFKVQADLKDHCLSSHRNQTMKCNVCKQTLHTANSVYLHSMRHSGTRDHRCHICNATFKRKQHLIAHTTTHEKSKEMFVCPGCDKSFSDKKVLRKHIDQVHKDIASNFKYDYQCSVCQKDFAYKGRLTEHMKYHENETEHEKSFRATKKRVDSLTEDEIEDQYEDFQRVVDPESKEVRLKCLICKGREFRMLSSANRHIEDHKKGRVHAKPPGTYRCPVCNKSFNSKIKLKSHSYMHVGDVENKPITSINPNKTPIAKKLPQCRKCNKTFKWKSCLQAHTSKCTVNPIRKGSRKRKATLKAIIKIHEQAENILSQSDEECREENVTKKIKISKKAFDNTKEERLDLSCAESITNPESSIVLVVKDKQTTSVEKPVIEQLITDNSTSIKMESLPQQRDPVEDNTRIILEPVEISLDDDIAISIANNNSSQSDGETTNSQSSENVDSSQLIEGMDSSQSSDYSDASKVTEGMDSSQGSDYSDNSKVTHDSLCVLQSTDSLTNSGNADHVNSSQTSDAQSSQNHDHFYLIQPISSQSFEGNLSLESQPLFTNSPISNNEAIQSHRVQHQHQRSNITISNINEIIQSEQIHQQQQQGNIIEYRRENDVIIQGTEQAEVTSVVNLDSNTSQVLENYLHFQINPHSNAPLVTTTNVNTLVETMLKLSKEDRNPPSMG